MNYPSFLVSEMCNPDFTDDDGIRKKIFACQNYTELEWCTSDEKQGKKWNEVKYGNLANYTNKFGESPFVCPQCGCGRGIIENFQIR